jgi:hypothetical protein
VCSCFSMIIIEMPINDFYILSLSICLSFFSVQVDRIGLEVSRGIAGIHLLIYLLLGGVFFKF